MAFILRRLAFYLVAFIVAAAINFALPRLMPGNPVDIMFSQAEGRMPPEVRDRLVGDLRLHRPAALRAVPHLSFERLHLGPRHLDQVLSAAGRPRCSDGRCPGRCCSPARRRCSASRSARSSASTRPGAAAAASMPSSRRWRWSCSRFPPVVLALTTLFIFGVALQWLPIGYAYAPALDPGLNLDLPRQRRLSRDHAGLRARSSPASAAT